MKKTVVTLTILALVLGFSLMPAVPVAAADINVPVDYSTIQVAIDAAAAGDTISVAAGTYNENIILKDGVSVLGAGAAVTTILGRTVHPVVTATGVGSTTRLDGFTITSSGGHYGMYNDSSSLTVTNCTFSGNEFGMVNDDSSLTVTNCTFSGNEFGMVNDDSSPTVTNCTFVANGTGMDNESHNFGTQTTVTNCIFSSNYGAGMSNENMVLNLSVTNCTFSGNVGPGMYNDYSNPTVTNCVFWGDDTDGYFGEEIYNTTAFLVWVTYSDVQGGYGGTGNINADPLFVNPASDDYHLQPGSPCIDTGSNSAPALPDTDFEGQPRIIDGDGDGTATVDMGADEYYVQISNHPPTISAIPDQTINEDTDTGALAFTVGDLETPADSLTVSGSSSDTALVPVANVVFGGSGANRSVTVSPAADQSGTATITVTVSDGELTASDSFVLTVISVDELPTMESFNISKMTVDFSRQDDRDSINMKASFALPDGTIFNAATDTVKFNIDGIVIDIPAGSFKGNKNESKYSYDSAKGVEPKVSVNLDFKKGEVTLVVKKANVAIIKNDDGVSVSFSIGSIDGQQTINMFVDALTFPQQR